MKKGNLKRLVSAFLMLCIMLTGVIFHAEEADLQPPVFSHEGGIYAEAFTLTIEGNGEEVFYTLDGSMPDKNSTPYTAPIEIAPKKVSPRSVQGRVSQQRWEKGIVVRAVTYNEEFNVTSPVVTNTYFVSDKVKELNENVPIVAISGNPYDFWDNEEGIYTNYEYEHNILGYVEYFDNNDEGFERSLELKVSGHGSRSNPKKSIRLYFTKGDTEGRKNLEYDMVEIADKNFYDTSKVEKHGKITFRISDWAETDLRDPMTQRITDFMRPDTAASTPAALFINGEFWGIYETREQYDNRYLDFHYEDIGKDDVIFLDRDWTTENYTFTLSDNGYQSIERILYEEGPEEDEEYYRDQYNYVQYLMLNAEDEEVYKELCGYVDIDNLIDYLFVCFYCDNIDWPGNNFKFWRTSMERSNGDVYAADGKWRFMVHDFDLAFDGVTNNTLEYALKSNLPETDARHPKFVAERFDGLFKNEDFRNKFAQRAAAYLNSAVSVENITAIAEDLIKDREAVKGYDLMRWNNMSGTLKNRTDSWRDRVRSKFIGFAENRNPYFEKMVSDFYKKYYKSEIGETTNFSFEIDTAKASVDIDGAVIRESFYPGKAASFTTTQYTSIPVTISAECKAGFVVKSITVNGEKFAGDKVEIVPEKKDYNVSFEIAEGTKEEKTVASIKVMREGRFSKMTVGEKLPVEVIATYTDGTSERVFGYMVTSETNSVDVGENGIVTAKTPGSGNMIVTYKGVKTNFTATVE
ncbi:MAG: CotH kinase family protein [Clostridia bacterium]|nr:CotH kinase family protein [Clostridia bacterium]